MMALKQLSIPTWVCFAFGVSGVWSMTCYNCVWMREGEAHLPSAVNQSDICRPENFKPLVVHTEECPYNCLTMFLYEYVDSDTLSQQIPFESHSKGKSSATTATSSRTALREFPNSLNITKKVLMMTFFYRGCSKDDHLWPQSFCKFQPVADKNSSYHYEKKCYCPSRFCNGEATSNATTNLPENWYLSALLLVTFAAAAAKHVY